MAGGSIRTILRLFYKTKGDVGNICNLSIFLGILPFMDEMDLSEGQEISKLLLQVGGSTQMGVQVDGGMVNWGMKKWIPRRSSLWMGTMHCAMPCSCFPNPLPSRHPKRSNIRRPSVLLSAESWVKRGRKTCR